LIQFVAFAMAELCSSMPTAGGLYYASAVLAPEGWGPLFAWVGQLPRFLYSRILAHVAMPNRLPAGLTSWAK
jgi:amino acid transporter